MANATTSTTFYRANFSGDANKIDYLKDKSKLSKEVEIHADMNTTALKVRELISESSGIPVDHLSLRVYKGSPTTQSPTLPSAYSYGTGPSHYPRDNELIRDAMKPLPPETSKEGYTTYGNPVLFFSAETCSDRNHCPDMVNVGTWNQRYRIPISNDMTIPQLQDAVAKTTGYGKELQRLFFKNQQIQDKEITLIDAGIEKESSLLLVFRLKPHNVKE